MPLGRHGIVARDGDPVPPVDRHGKPCDGSHLLWRQRLLDVYCRRGGSVLVTNSGDLLCQRESRLLFAGEVLRLPPCRQDREPIGGLPLLDRISGVHP